MKKIYLTLGLGALLLGANAQTAKISINGNLKKDVSYLVKHTQGQNSVASTDSMMYIPCNDPQAAQLYYSSIDVDNVIDTGYIFGTNSFPYTYSGTTYTISNSECAQKYNISGSANIVGTAFVAGQAYSSAATSTIVSNIYSEDPTTKGPDALLGTSDVMTLQSVSEWNLNTFTFSNPVAVSNQNFFASVTSPFLGGATEDTLSILFSDPSCTGLTSDSLSWSYSGVYQGTTLVSQFSFWVAAKSGVFGNHYNVDLAIYPIIEMNTMDISKVAKGSLSLYAASPNPANSSINFNFELNNNSKVEVEIYDVTGKKVKSIKNDETFASGKHAIALDLASFEAGTYLYSINANGNKMFSKFVVTK